MSIFAYRDAYSRDGGNIDFGEMHASGDLTAGQVTPWYNLTPRKGKKYVLGTIVKCQYVLTAPGAATPNSGSDVLDPLLTGGLIQIAGQSDGPNRSQSLTRQFIEFLYAVMTNTSFSIAALPTFASAGTSTVTVSFFVPVGGVAAALQIKLPAGILGAATSGTTPGFGYTSASAVTISYSFITTQIVSSNFSGVVAFKEGKTASLSTGLQSVLQYVPSAAVSADAAFMAFETSATITQVQVASIDGQNELISNDTDALQIGAAAIAPIAGATYTTTAGFVMSLDGKQFQTFMLNFANATIHWIGLVQVQGGGDAEPGVSPQPSQATPAVQNTGTVTPSGAVTSASATGRGAPSGGGGGGRGKSSYRGRR